MFGFANEVRAFQRRLRAVHEEKGLDPEQFLFKLELSKLINGFNCFKKTFIEEMSSQ